MTSAAFSPDGTRVVTTSIDQTARVWEILTPVGSTGRAQPIRRHRRRDRSAHTYHPLNLLPAQCEPYLSGIAAGVDRCRRARALAQFERR